MLSEQYQLWIKKTFLLNVLAVQTQNSYYHWQHEALKSRDGLNGSYHDEQMHKPKNIFTGQWFLKTGFLTMRLKYSYTLDNEQWTRLLKDSLYEFKLANHIKKKKKPVNKTNADSDSDVDAIVSAVVFLNCYASQIKVHVQYMVIFLLLDSLLDCGLKDHKIPIIRLLSELSKSGQWPLLDNPKGSLSYEGKCV